MIDKKIAVFNSGKELFSSKGFKDTNVSDITKMAGIGVGTFYNYYSSKEELFMEIFIKENEMLKKSIMESIDLNAEPIEVAREVMSMNLQRMNSNLILREWYNKDSFSKFEQSYHEKYKKNDADYIENFFAKLIRKWQEEGKIRNDISIDLIMALFYSIASVVDSHKEEVGIQHFPQILDYFMEFIMKGLTDFTKTD